MLRAGELITAVTRSGASSESPWRQQQRGHVVSPTCGRGRTHVSRRLFDSPTSGGPTRALLNLVSYKSREFPFTASHAPPCSSGGPTSSCHPPCPSLARFPRDSTHNPRQHGPCRPTGHPGWYLRGRARMAGLGRGLDASPSNRRLRVPKSEPAHAHYLLCIGPCPSYKMKIVSYNPSASGSLADAALKRAREGKSSPTRRPREMALLSAHYRYEDTESPLHREKVSIAASVALCRYFSVREWNDICKRGYREEAVRLLEKSPLSSYWTNYVLLLLEASPEVARQAMSGKSDRKRFVQHAHTE